MYRDMLQSFNRPYDNEKKRKTKLKKKENSKIPLNKQAKRIQIAFRYLRCKMYRNTQQSLNNNEKKTKKEKLEGEKQIDRGMQRLFNRKGHRHAANEGMGSYQ